MEFTNHFRNMLEERSIRKEWVDKYVNEPEKIEDHEDGSRHFLRRIEEHGNRWLRVVVNMQGQPNRAVTAFFDRRLGRKQ
jgi:hypothetical protein